MTSAKDSVRSAAQSHVYRAVSKEFGLSARLQEWKETLYRLHTISCTRLRCTHVSLDASGRWLRGKIGKCTSFVEMSRDEGYRIVLQVSLMPVRNVLRTVRTVVL